MRRSGFEHVTDATCSRRWPEKLLLRVSGLGLALNSGSHRKIWEFPKIGVPYFGGPYSKDPTN